jgi:hypothetical protein
MESSVKQRIIHPLHKQLGRRPLPDDKRRVQFGTRIAPTTLDGLKKIAESKGNMNYGRIIDELVSRFIDCNA